MKRALIIGGRALSQLYDRAGSIAYTVLASFVILQAIDWTIGPREPKQNYREGPDIRAHGKSVA